MLKLNSFRNLKFGRGFTLIELLVAVIIIGILSAFAFPSYQKYVQRTKRADAERALLEIRQALERGYSVKYNYAAAYTGDAASIIFTGAAPNTTFYPSANLPKDYTIAGDGGVSDYVLMAAPTGGQVGDVCGVLTINQSGVKTPAQNVIPNCW